MKQTGTPYEGGIYDVVSGILRALSPLRLLADVTSCISIGYSNTGNLSFLTYQDEVHNVSRASLAQITGSTAVASLVGK